MLTSVEGRSVIVTGSSKGIGKGIASVFAKHGARVLIVARGMADAEATVEEIRNNGGTASACSADVTSSEDLDAMAAAAVEQHGGIDILCCNAGIFPQNHLENMSSDEWDLVLGTNLKGHVSRHQELPATPQRERIRSHSDYIINYRTNNGVPRVDALWCK